MLKMHHVASLRTLPRSQLDIVWRDLIRQYPAFPVEPPEATPELLVDLLAARRMDHASLLSPMFRETAPDAVAAIETLLGKPITRPQPRISHARAAFNGRPQRARPADDRVISAIVSNPKKPGSASHARFALYEEGMTVSQALAKGVTTADIKWDSERGFIQIA